MLVYALRNSKVLLEQTLYPFILLACSIFSLALVMCNPLTPFIYECVCVYLSQWSKTHACFASFCNGIYCNIFKFCLSRIRYLEFRRCLYSRVFCANVLANTRFHEHCGSRYDFPSEHLQKYNRENFTIFHVTYANVIRAVESICIFVS